MPQCLNGRPVCKRCVTSRSLGMSQDGSCARKHLKYRARGHRKRKVQIMPIQACSFCSLKPSADVADVASTCIPRQSAQHLLCFSKPPGTALKLNHARGNRNCTLGDKIGQIGLTCSRWVGSGLGLGWRGLVTRVHALTTRHCQTRCLGSQLAQSKDARPQLHRMIKEHMTSKTELSRQKLNPGLGLQATSRSGTNRFGTLLYPCKRLEKMCVCREGGLAVISPRPSKRS